MTEASRTKACTSPRMALAENVPPPLMARLAMGEAAVADVAVAVELIVALRSAVIVTSPPVTVSVDAVAGDDGPAK